MSQIHKGLTVAELGAIVSEALNSAGIQAVLCGGSVATIYSGHQLESKDLDFVVARVDKKRIAELFTELGFERRGLHESLIQVHRNAVFHCRLACLLEVASTPAALGSDGSPLAKTDSSRSGCSRSQVPTGLRLIMMKLSFNRVSAHYAVRQVSRASQPPPRDLYNRMSRVRTSVSLSVT